MNIITLEQIFGLVGILDDAPGDDTARERFRRFLLENIREVGQVRDYIEECLRTSGDQYNRALQDLVNHLGHFLGFSVTFGRYKGISNEIGFDGLWKSPTGFSIVIEVKTSETYAINTAPLIGYVDRLISAREIRSWESAIGLYVIGRPDPETRQLENTILAEKRTGQLRVISVESLLSLTEMMNDYDVAHEDTLDILYPPGPAIDPVVDLMARLVAQSRSDDSAAHVTAEFGPEIEGETMFWLTSVKSDEAGTWEDTIHTLVNRERIYAFGERTPGRKSIKPGDWICFYGAGTGVVAHARITTRPKKQPHPSVRNPERYPWVFQLGDAYVYTDTPTVIDAELRSQLDAFRDRDPNGPWAWFVQATHSLSQHDFETLTRG